MSANAPTLLGAYRSGEAISLGHYMSDFSGEPAEPIRFPVPAYLRAEADETVEDALAVMPAWMQRAYRRFLAEEVTIGHVPGSPRPAMRALERASELRDRLELVADPAPHQERPPRRGWLRRRGRS